MCGFLGLSWRETRSKCTYVDWPLLLRFATRSTYVVKSEPEMAAERSSEVRLREALKRVLLVSNHPSGEILSATQPSCHFVEIHGMRMVDMLGNGYITTPAAMVAFLAFMDLRACALH